MTEPTTHFRPEELLDHASWIRRLARRLVGDEERAEDLVQETWLTALRSRPDGDRSLRPWLARVARNCARAWHRGDASARGREQQTAREEGLPPTNELVERTEMQRLVVDEVLRLDEPYRSALILRFYEGLEPAAIAKRQGVPAGTVRSRLKRGIDRLRERLDGHYSGDRGAWVAGLAPLFAPAWEVGAAASVTTAVKGGFIVHWVVRTAVILALFALGIVGLQGWNRLISTDVAEAPIVVDLGDAELAGLATPALEPAGGELDGQAGATSNRRVGSAPRGATSAGPTEVATAETAPVHGLLVDDRTGEPIPRYKIWLRVSELPGEEPDTRVKQRWGEEVWTDESGRFETEKAYPTSNFDVGLGELQAMNGALRGAWDFGTPTEPDPLEYAHVVTDGAAAAAEIAIPVGPTYRFDLLLPPGHEPDDFVIHLRRSDSAPVDQGRRSWSQSTRAVVREGDGARRHMARFGPQSREVPGAPWTLVFQSRNGLWSAEVEVDTVVGVNELTDAVQPRSVGALRGHVRFSAEEPENMNWIVLVPGADAEIRSLGDAPHRSLVRYDDERQLVYRLPWIEPGAYTLMAEAPGYEPYRHTVQITAGDQREHDILLEHDPDATARPATGELGFDRVVEGVVRSSSGTFDEPLMVDVVELGYEPEDRRRGHGRVELAWEDLDGERIARFRVEGLPPGEYAVAVFSAEDPAFTLKSPVTPEDLRTRPGNPVELLVNDEIDGIGIAVRAVDDETGDPIEDFDLYGVHDGPWAGAGLLVSAEDGLAAIEVVERARELDYQVRAGGYRFGRIAGEDIGGDDELVVRLVRGFSLEVVVSERPAGELPRALPGVRVWLDDELIGSTGANGRLCAELDGEPERLRVEYGDWVGAGGDIDPADGRLYERHLRNGFVRIYLKPPQ